jgi:hypothetical protein
MLWLCCSAIVVALVAPPSSRPSLDSSPSTRPARSDQAVFHDLLRHHAEIRRTVRDIPGGVETLTESDNPEVAGWIREHVQAMKARVETGRPIRRWDPLFRVIFDHAASIRMEVQPTPAGVRVRETSDQPHVAALIRAHAQVVSAFIARGFDEAHEPHPLPPTTAPATSQPSSHLP